VTGAAYTNNFAATTTALFVIDSQMDALFRQDPPNNGTLVSIGNLGVNVDADSGFDIEERVLLLLHKSKQCYWYILLTR
jgi:hypothetical protein